MKRPFGSMFLALTAVTLAACSDSTGSGSAGPPAALDIVSGNQQQAVVGTELANPLVVKVTDAKGKPVKGQVVNFQVTSGGGHVFAGTGLTNGDGIAQERWTLGTVAGDTQRVEARAVDSTTGQALVLATFTAVGIAAAPATMTALGPPSTNATQDAPYSDILAVHVEDAYHNPVPGTTVTWTVQTGGGTVTPQPSTTDAGGTARVTWQVVPRADTTKTITATVGASTVAFTVKGIPAPVPTTLLLQAIPMTGSRYVVQSGSNTRFLVAGTPVQLQVNLTDQYETPVAGQTVTLSLAAGDGVLGQTVLTTDASGRATTTWTSGTQIGTTGNVTRTMRLTATSGALTSHYDLLVAPDAPVTLTIVPDTTASVAVGDSVSVRAYFTDQYGNDAEQQYAHDVAPTTAVETADTAIVAIHRQVGDIRYVIGEQNGVATVTITRTAMSWLAEVSQSMTGTMHVHVGAGAPAPSRAPARVAVPRAARVTPSSRSAGR